MALIQDILASKAPRDIISIDPRKTVTEAAKMMSHNKVGSVLVLDEGKLLGVFTERDLMNKVVAQDKDPQTTPVQEVMTSKVAVGKTGMTIQEATEIMSQNRIRHFPIAEDGKVINMISAGDILTWQAKQNEMAVRHLENYFLT